MTPGKRALLAAALFSLIASSVFSMWQTTLQSLSDDVPLIRESSLLSIRAAFTWDPVDREMHRLVASQKREIERISSWQLDNDLFYEYAQENNLDDPDYGVEVKKAIARMRLGYESFVIRHADHVLGRIAYGDYLEQIEDYPGATAQWAIAMKLDPLLAAAWERQARVAIGNEDFNGTLDSFSQAIELEPDNWNYHYRVAAIVLGNLEMAAAHYHEEPNQSATRAISHYRQALSYNPSNFQLASELAFAYAKLSPPNYDASMAAWEHTARCAYDDTDLEGVYLSMAQVSIDAERFDTARKLIARSSLPNFRRQRALLLRKIAYGEKASLEKSGG